MPVLAAARNRVRPACARARDRGGGLRPRRGAVGQGGGWRLPRDRGRRGAVGLHRAFGGPDPRRRHAVPAGGGDRGRRDALRGRHPAQGEGREPPALVDLLADDGRSDGRMAGRPVWAAVLARHRFRLPRPFAPPDARPADAKRSRTGRPLRAACEGEGDRHRLQPARHDALRRRRACRGGRGHRPRRAGAHRLRRACPGLQRLWRQPRDGRAPHAGDHGRGLVRS
jgi:hypothetical protein